eukprot:TRINITY_DN6148_c0_g1_i1.p1 TRINITY_DN6148_c0_g1~~TRINITY_DN6148_c0_g1_i1.p1  ORF type:complete len:458 (+),score=97.55 TRINITY_DN6148_c0_g1_i1:116-1489(+)
MSKTTIATTSSKPPATAVASAFIARVEQRLSPRKHFAYVIRMIWNNDEETYAVRSHLELFHFQCRLLDYYPAEAGLGDYQRIIPRLPGKHAYAKTEEKAKKFVQPVQTYLQELFNLPPEVSRSDMVLNFFMPTPADRNFADIERTLASHSDKVSTSGLKIDQLRQHQNARLSRLVEEEKKQTQAVAVAVAKRGTEDPSGRRNTGEQLLSMLVKNKLDFEAGERLDVIRMTSCPGGHWYCRNTQGQEGFVPIDYVEIDAGSVMDVLTKAYSRQNSTSDGDAEAGDVNASQPHAISMAHPAPSAEASEPSETTTTPSEAQLASTQVQQPPGQLPTLTSNTSNGDESKDNTCGSKPENDLGQNEPSSRQEQLQPGDVVVAVFDFVGEATKELTFEAGTVLRVEKLEKDGWLLGTILRLPEYDDAAVDDGIRRPSVRNQRGWFPAAYCEALNDYCKSEEDE